MQIYFASDAVILPQ